MPASIEFEKPRPSGAASIRVAYVLDPRFPGGTSSAVAAELEAVHRLANLRVYALETSMFSGQRIAPQLSEALARLKLPLQWNCRKIAADIVVFHNPSCLKFQDQLNVQIIARHLIAVTHENFFRPSGAPAFDIDHCLSQITSSSLVLRRSLAPVSAWNRKTVEKWLHSRQEQTGWALLAEDWFNICAFARSHPNETPGDRRGRHSRPGQEKFPNRVTMDLCFPKSAESNTILGADTLMSNGGAPVHWRLYKFGELSVAYFFDQIDFFVYYTAPTWRESFGRVIAEAIAAGKLVITDPETAVTFGGGAIGADPKDIDRIITDYLAQPTRYVDDVLAAQKLLDRFSAAAFCENFRHLMSQEMEAVA